MQKFRLPTVHLEEKDGKVGGGGGDSLKSAAWILTITNNSILPFETARAYLHKVVHRRSHILKDKYFQVELSRCCYIIFRLDEFSGKHISFDKEKIIWGFHQSYTLSKLTCFWLKFTVLNFLGHFLLPVLSAPLG